MAGKGGMGPQKASAKKQATKSTAGAKRANVAAQKKSTAAAKAKVDAKYKAQVQKILHPAPAAKKPTPRKTDWDKGIEAEKSIAARNRQLQKVIRGK